MSQPVPLPPRSDGRANGNGSHGNGSHGHGTNGQHANGSAGGAPPRRQAVAISYDPNQSDAPVVTAAGQGLVAEEIIRRAREAGVPVTEDARLAAVLSQIDVGQMIPPELYAVVAEVLAYVYRLEDRIGRRR